MLIVFRYLTRQILVNMLAVTGVLLLVLMSGRFIKYLAQAASGGIAAGVLFPLMAYRIPGFLELILPLALFIGILLAYGRMYLESEMVVLHACGVSERQIITQTMGAGLLMTVIVAVVSLWVAPWGMAKAQAIIKQQAQGTEFEMLVPGRFLALRNGKRVTYTQSLSDDKRKLHNVFMAEPAEKGKPLVLISAASGEQHVDPTTKSRFLVLHNGARIQGNPGTLDYRVTTFDDYGLRLTGAKDAMYKLYDDAASTAQLMASGDLADRAMLQWRISLALIVPIVTLLAVRMSRVNPRQGRFFHLLPSMLIYIAYLGTLIAARNAVSEGRIPLWAGLWWVHGLFLAVTLALIGWPVWRRRRRAGHA